MTDPREPLHSRTQRARDLLREIADAYQRGHKELHGIASTAYDGGRSSGPRSARPPGTDVDLRASLVRVARHIADAHAELSGTVTRPWRPTRLGSRSGGADVDCYHGHEAVTCRLLGGAWNPEDASDVLTPPQPDVLRSACLQLASRLSDLGADDEDRFHACRWVDKAVGTLRHAGLWERPSEARHVDERCENFPMCTGFRGEGRRECWRCVKARYRRRKRARKRVKAGGP